MLYIDSDGNIRECYNSQVAGGVSQSDTGPDGCHFYVSHPSLGDYFIDFGFAVGDRFYALSARHEHESVIGGPDIDANKGANFSFADVNVLEVMTFYADERSDRTNGAFMLIVY